MAIGNQLERIAGLVEQLAPLSHKQRGMRIEADEWNAVVNALLGVLEIDRAQEQAGMSALNDQFSRIGHQHLGEITNEWLDPNLQGTAGSGSVTARAALAAMDQRIQSLSTEVARLTALAEAQQQQLDRAQVNELDRSRLLRGFENRFGGVENLRTVTTTLSNQVEGLNRHVGVVLELRKSLSDPAGNPIDVGKIQQDLRDLQTLRDNLKGVDGNLLRMRDFEIKIREIEDTLDVSGSGKLDQRFANFSAELRERFDVQLETRATQLRAEFQGLNEQTTTGLRTELATQLEATRASQLEVTRQQIDAAEARLSAHADQRIATLSDQLRSETSATATSLIDQRLADLPTRIRTVIDGMRGDLERAIGARLMDELSGRLRSQFADLAGTLDLQIGTLQNRLDGLRSEINSTLAEQLAGERDAIFSELSTRLDGMRRVLSQQVDERIKGMLDESLGGLDSRISELVERSLSSLDGRIRDVVAGVVQQLPEQISREVGAQISALDVNGQIQTLNDALTKQFRAELGQALVEQQARNSRELEAVVATLRIDLDSSNRATVEEINKTFEVWRRNTFVELNQVMDERLRNIRSQIGTEFTQALDQRLQDQRGALTVEFNQLLDRATAGFKRDLQRIDTDVELLRRRR